MRKPDNTVHHDNVIFIVPSVGRNGKMEIIKSKIPYVNRRRSWMKDLEKDKYVEINSDVLYFWKVL